MSAGIVLVHGGMHSSRCWERVLPHLAHDAIAVDLPGRGRRPGPVHGLRVRDFVAAAREDVEATGWDEVVVVAHSLGGLTALGLSEAVPDVVKHLVLVSCVTPKPGDRPVDDLAQPFRWYITRSMTRAIRRHGALDIPRPLKRRFFCSDLDRADTEHVLAQCVPDAPATLIDRVSSQPLPSHIGRTWVRLTQDKAISPRVQDRMRANIAPANVLELAAGHDAMISRPRELADLVNEVAAAALAV